MTEKKSFDQVVDELYEYIGKILCVCMDNFKLIISGMEIPFTVKEVTTVYNLIRSANDIYHIELRNTNTGNITKMRYLKTHDVIMCCVDINGISYVKNLQKIDTIMYLLTLDTGFTYSIHIDENVV